MGVLECLGIVFVALKLCGVIAWSWWLVTLPFYGALLLYLVIFTVMYISLAIRGASRKPRR